MTYTANDSCINFHQETIDAIMNMSRSDILGDDNSDAHNRNLITKDLKTLYKASCDKDWVRKLLADNAL